MILIQSNPGPIHLKCIALPAELGQYQHRNALGSVEKRELIGYAREKLGMSLRLACLLFSLSTSVFYYQLKRKNDDEVIEQLSKLADLNRTWGFWMMYNRLRKLQYLWNHKRVYRIYTNMRLNLRNKRNKRLPARVKAPLLCPIGPYFLES